MPETQRERYEYLRKTWVNEPITEAVRQSLTKWYGPQADAAQQVESFELCEYGRIPDDEQLRTLFPFFETGS